MDFKSSAFMYGIGAIVVVFVIAESLFFLIRAYRQGKKIGLSTQTMNKTIISSSLFSIPPAISILATVLTLSAALGIVLPWIRLTVIGSITYEVPAAQSALEAVGSTGGLAVEVTDEVAFSTAAWVMTLGSVLGLILVPIFAEFIQKKVGGVLKKNNRWANLMSSAAFIGLISAFVGRAILGSGDADTFGDGAGVLSIAALLSSSLLMLLFMKINQKVHKTWIDTFAMPISMFFALFVVVILNMVLPESIATLEWRG